MTKTRGKEVKTIFVKIYSVIFSTKTMLKRKKLFPLKFMLLSFITKTRLKEAKIIFVKIYAAIFYKQRHVKRGKHYFC